ncbi:MAG: hypothetical protein ACLQDY_15310 [Streptosporangiaceae bacterium]
MTGLLAVLIPAATAGWLAHSWWWPYTSCRSCRGRRGKGTGSRPSARFYNRCRRCGGSGEAVRIGAVLISKATGRPVRGSDQ